MVASLEKVRSSEICNKRSLVDTGSFGGIKQTTILRAVTVQDSIPPIPPVQRSLVLLQSSYTTVYISLSVTGEKQCLMHLVISDGLF